MKKVIILATALVFSLAVMAQEPAKKAEKKAAKTEKVEKAEVKKDEKADKKEAKAGEAAEKKTCPHSKDGKHCGKHQQAAKKEAPVTK